MAIRQPGTPAVLKGTHRQPLWTLLHHRCRDESEVLFLLFFNYHSFFSSLPSCAEFSFFRDVS